MKTLGNMIFSGVLVTISAILLFLLSTITAHCDETFFSYGAGVFKSVDTKMLNMGYRTDSFFGFNWQIKVGGWISPESNVYLSSGPQFLVDVGPIELRNGLSLCAIGNSDRFLGGRFPQFNSELYLGLRDKNGNGIGIQVEHISSAGIFNPNLGKDFIMLQLSSKW